MRQQTRNLRRSRLPSDNISEQDIYICLLQKLYSDSHKHHQLVNNYVDSFLKSSRRYGSQDVNVRGKYTMMVSIYTAKNRKVVAAAALTVAASLPLLFRVSKNVKGGKKS